MEIQKSIAGTRLIGQTAVIPYKKLDKLQTQKQYVKERTVDYPSIIKDLHVYLSIGVSNLSNQLSKFSKNLGIQ